MQKPTLYGIKIKINDHLNVKRVSVRTMQNPFKGKHFELWHRHFHSTVTFSWVFVHSLTHIHVHMFTYVVYFFHNTRTHTHTYIACNWATRVCACVYKRVRIHQRGFWKEHACYQCDKFKVYVKSKRTGIDLERTYDGLRIDSVCVWGHVRARLYIQLFIVHRSSTICGLGKRGFYLHHWQLCTHSRILLEILWHLTNDYRSSRVDRNE